jgi:hypothetical protein
MAAKEDGLWFHFMLSEKGESQVASALKTTTKKNGMATFELTPP